MSKDKKRYVGKIGYCSNKDLPTLRHLPKGHYVYIRKIYPDGTCDVNTITSLEDKHGNFNPQRLYYVRHGDTYPIPKGDINLPLWSGVRRDVITGVKLSDIRYVGFVGMKRRHKFFIGKFMNNYPKRRR